MSSDAANTADTMLPQMRRAAQHLPDHTRKAQRDLVVLHQCRVQLQHLIPSGALMNVLIPKLMMLLGFLIAVFGMLRATVATHEDIHRLIDEDYGDSNIKVRLNLYGLLGGLTSSNHTINNATDAAYYQDHHNNEIAGYNTLAIIGAIMISALWLGMISLAKD